MVRTRLLALAALVSLATTPVVHGRDWREHGGGWRDRGGDYGHHHKGNAGAAIIGGLLGRCHLNRKMNDLTRAAGFRVNALETGYMKGPKPWILMYQGSARPEAPEAS